MINQKDLKEKLFGFYNACNDYFTLASESNKVPTEERNQVLQFIPENSKVLDVACGTAENAEIISQKAFYYGIEISNIALSLAEEKYFDNKRIVLRKGDAENLPYPDNYFDVVLSTYSLEHFTDPQRAIDEMLRVCKPGGKVILISPAWDNPFWVSPALTAKLKGFPQRLIFILSQTTKLFLLSFGAKKWFFDIIEQPEVLQTGFQMDNDAVYIVRVREVKNYISSKKCRIIYLRKSPTILLLLEKPFFKYFKHNCLVSMASIMNIFYRYLNVGLFIVAGKK